MSRPSRYQARLPLDQLLVATGHTMTSLGRIVRRSPSALRDYTERGGLTLDQADHMAITCGLHPAEVWGERWWYAAAYASPFSDADRRRFRARVRAIWNTPVEAEPDGRFCGRPLTWPDVRPCRLAA